MKITKVAWDWLKKLQMAFAIVLGLLSWNASFLPKKC